MILLILVLLFNSNFKTQQYKNHFYSPFVRNYTYRYAAFTLSGQLSAPDKWTQSGRSYFTAILVSTPKTRFSEHRFSEHRFSEHQFSEILDLMNKLQLPFSYFTLYTDSVF